MLGFKLEMAQREESLTKKERPIYLDMQVNGFKVYSRNCAQSVCVGNNARGPEGTGCHAAISYRPVWQPSQQDACVWLGG
jgi:hypothetical protein